MSSTPSPSDRFIPWYFVGFFVLLALILAGLCTIAFRTYTGEVTQGAYNKGLAYNSTLREALQQSRLGWKSNLAITPSQGAILVNWRLADAQGRPITSAKVDIWCIRAAQAGFDVHASLQDSGKGLYSGKIPLPLHGAWEVHVSATYNGHNYQQMELTELP